METRIPSRLALASLVAAGMGVLMPHTAALAQGQYPDHPIRVVVPYSPGGNTDVITRAVMKELATRLGQTILVENKPGANAVIGADFVAKAKPDGYTLAVAIGGYAINQTLYKKLPYGPKDLIPVSLMTRTALVLVANPTNPTGSLQAFINYGRTPGTALNYSTSGAGGANHLLGERFAGATGIKATAVPYKGSSDGWNDLLAGRVQFTFDAIATMSQYVKQGSVKALAVASDARSPLLPNVPTLRELGYPQLTTYAWAGLLAPAGTPAPIVDRLSREIAAIFKDEAIRAKFEAMGTETVGSTPAEFDTFLTEEVKTTGAIIRKLGLSVE